MCDPYVKECFFSSVLQSSGRNVQLRIVSSIDFFEKRSPDVLEICFFTWVIYDISMNACHLQKGRALHLVIEDSQV